MPDIVMTKSAGEPTVADASKIFHWPLTFDLFLKVFWGSKERSYRQTVLRLAHVTAGEAVLDVGCGTGTLAIAGRPLVGSTGRVAGVDASPEMIARAKGKARKAAADIDFRLARADSLPFAEASFDVVVTTTVLHCLPREALVRCFTEMRRVLKPSGRLLAIDFAQSNEPRRSLIAHMSHHRTFDLYGVIPDMQQAGFGAVKTGLVGFSDLHYVSAVASETHMVSTG